jgi:methionine aminopeptidase
MGDCCLTPHQQCSAKPCKEQVTFDGRHSAALEHVILVQKKTVFVLTH